MGYDEDDDPDPMGLGFNEEMDMPDEEPEPMGEPIDDGEMMDSEWLLVTVNGRFRRVRKVAIIDFGVEADGKVHLHLVSGKDMVIEETEDYVKTMLGVHF